MAAIHLDALGSCMAACADWGVCASSDASVITTRVVTRSTGTESDSSCVKHKLDCVAKRADLRGAGGLWREEVGLSQGELRAARLLMLSSKCLVVSCKYRHQPVGGYAQKLLLESKKLTDDLQEERWYEVVR